MATNNVFSLSRAILGGIWTKVPQLWAWTNQSLIERYPLRLATRAYSSTASSSKDEVKSYDPPSPYRNPGPRRFGYETRLHKGGLLPRSPTKKFVSIPRYEPKDSWNRKRALFGQNDYIDILGDGNIRPFDLLKGPKWILGFKGNELQRIIRQLKFDGPRLQFLYPTEYKNLRKRLRYLYKRYNYKRSNKHH